MIILFKKEKLEVVSKGINKKNDKIILAL